MDGRAVVLANRIELINAAHAAIPENERASFQHPFATVLNRRARQSSTSPQSS